MNKMINLDEYVGKVFHCPTEELANEFLMIAHKQGWSWSSWSMGKPLVEENYWDDYKENTCYILLKNKTVMFSEIDFYEKGNYTIIEFEGERKWK